MIRPAIVIFLVSTLTQYANSNPIPPDVSVEPTAGAVENATIGAVTVGVTEEISITISSEIVDTASIEEETVTDKNDSSDDGLISRAVTDDYADKDDDRKNDDATVAAVVTDDHSDSIETTAATPTVVVAAATTAANDDDDQTVGNDASSATAAADDGEDVDDEDKDDDVPSATSVADCAAANYDIDDAANSNSDSGSNPELGDNSTHDDYDDEYKDYRDNFDAGEEDDDSDVETSSSVDDISNVKHEDSSQTVINFNSDSKRLDEDVDPDFHSKDEDDTSSPRFDDSLALTMNDNIFNFYDSISSEENESNRDESNVSRETNKIQSTSDSESDKESSSADDDFYDDDDDADADKSEIEARSSIDEDNSRFYDETEEDYLTATAEDDLDNDSFYDESSGQDSKVDEEDKSSYDENEVEESTLGKEDKDTPISAAEIAMSKLLTAVGEPNGDEDGPAVNNAVPNDFFPENTSTEEADIDAEYEPTFDSSQNEDDSTGDPAIDHSAIFAQAEPVYGGDLENAEPQLGHIPKRRGNSKTKKNKHSVIFAQAAPDSGVLKNLEPDSSFPQVESEYHPSGKRCNEKKGNKVKHWYHEYQKLNWA